MDHPNHTPAASPPTTTGDPKRSSILSKGHELYSALRAGDADALQRLLSRDFQGHLSAGLPNGLGRTYDGLDAMLSEAWAPIDELFELDLKVEQLLEAGQVLVARGVYEGEVRQTGKQIRAAFAHFWQFDGDRFVSLHQVTDTAMWRDALG